MTKKTENDISFEFDIKPYSYQKEILENLEAEREIFGRYKNLVVAATGVGKTVISAFEYKKFREKNTRARLLFVAHREEILKKSRDTFRYICKDLNFGVLFWTGQYFRASSLVSILGKADVLRKRTLVSHKLLYSS